MLSLNLTSKLSFKPTIIHKIFETNSSFYETVLLEMFNFYFLEFFASIEEKLF